jgi:hypothetical protein
MGNDEGEQACRTMARTTNGSLILD